MLLAVPASALSDIQDGIGRGSAWGLADAGCDVVLNARRQSDLDETAAGVVERGTTHAQRVVVADLATLPRRVLEEGVRPPSLTVVGSVVGLYPKLA